jgi:hypothetical protein
MKVLATYIIFGVRGGILRLAGLKECIIGRRPCVRYLICVVVVDVVSVISNCCMHVYLPFN